MTGEVETAPAPRGKRYWPWLGRVRRYIYVDFAVYLALLVTFCVATLSTTSFDRSYDAYHLVRSVQKTLLEEARSQPLALRSSLIMNPALHRHARSSCAVHHRAAQPSKRCQADTRRRSLGAGTR